MKLNLGCGEKKLEGFLNCDIDKNVKPDKRLDLTKFPYPFKDNSAEEILMEHTLEHMAEPFKVLKELHRIAKPEATIRIMVPHGSAGWHHWDHKSFWSVDAFEVGWLKNMFSVKKRRLKWFRYGWTQRKLYYPFFWISWLVDLLANIQPTFCERFWCYWVGGFEEIEFELEPNK